MRLLGDGYATVLSDHRRLFREVVESCAGLVIDHRGDEFFVVFEDAVRAAEAVSEALANVTKYAQASAVKVTVEQANGSALVEVSDDGVGGADPARGSGLRGLADRVASLNGKLAIDSPPGAGTRVRAEIPLE